MSRELYTLLESTVVWVAEPDRSSSCAGRRHLAAFSAASLCYDDSDRVGSMLLVPQLGMIH